MLFMKLEHLAKLSILKIFVPLSAPRSAFYLDYLFCKNPNRIGLPMHNQVRTQCFDWMQTAGIAGSRNVVQKYRCALIYLLLYRGHMWFQPDQDGRRDGIFFYEGAARISQDLHIPLVTMNRLLKRFHDQSIMQRSESGVRMIQLGTTRHTTKRFEGWNRLWIRTGSMLCRGNCRRRG